MSVLCVMVVVYVYIYIHSGSVTIWLSTQKKNQLHRDFKPISQAGWRGPSLTADIEVIVSRDDHVGCSAFLWLGGVNGVTEQLTLGGREGSGQHIHIGHDAVDTDAQVFDDLQLVVGIPEVT